MSPSTPLFDTRCSLGHRYSVPWGSYQTLYFQYTTLRLHKRPHYSLHSSVRPCVCLSVCPSCNSEVENDRSLKVRRWCTGSRGRCLWRFEAKMSKFRTGALEVFKSWGGKEIRGSGGRKSPVGSRGKAPVGRLGDEVPRSWKLFWNI